MATVATPIHRTSPASLVLVVIALAGALLLGFGLRTWTESTPKAPAPVVVHDTATPPSFDCRLVHPC